MSFLRHLHYNEDYYKNWLQPPNVLSENQQDVQNLNTKDTSTDNPNENNNDTKEALNECDATASNILTP